MFIMGVFFKDMVFWIVYFLAKCDRDWVLFKIRTMPIYLLSEFLFADGEATYGMRCASYHTEKSMREDRGFLFHFFFLPLTGTTLLLFLPFFTDYLPPTRNGEYPKIE